MENNIDNVKDTSVDSQPTLKKKKTLIRSKINN